MVLLDDVVEVFGLVYNDRKVATGVDLVDGRPTRRTLPSSLYGRLPFARYF